MNKVQRIFIFLLLFSVLVIIYWFIAPVGSPDINALIFTTLIALSFAMLFVEHYFSSPTDAIANSLSVLLVLAPMHAQLSNMGYWYWVFIIFLEIVLISGLISLSLADKDKPASAWENKIAGTLKTFAITFGNAKAVYFVLFILAMLFYIDLQSSDFLILFGYAAIILLIDPTKSFPKLFKKTQSQTTELGEIFAIQSGNIFLVKLFEKSEKVNRFTLVSFKFSMDVDSKIRLGMVIDKYLLNKEKWIRVLNVSEAPTLQPSHPDRSRSNIVYKYEADSLPDPLPRLIGIVIENSTIEKIRFEYKPNAKISEGYLLEINISGEKVFYQVIQGKTTIESLKSQDETGYVVGEAVQLGVWNKKHHIFEKYGWLPDINSPIYTAEKIGVIEPGENELQIGQIPNSDYPIFLSQSDAISHHIAVLGVTGIGKSVFTRHLIRNIIENGYKVICVDFTNEYSEKFGDLNFCNIVQESKSTALFSIIDQLSDELSKFKNQQNRTLVSNCEKSLRNEFNSAICDFYKSDKKIALFELPDVSNSLGIFEYTRWFFKILFEIAKKEKNKGNKVCIVLEEAHTVIPEWNFIGASDKEAQSLVNNIGQIALQGRKYNVGFVVVAQRTANVSKTVLTQCNTIITFRQHDNTSKDFLSNYFGEDMINALPNLKFRQAIAVGKALKTGVPVIFDVLEIDEDKYTKKEPEKGESVTLKIETV